MRAWRRTLLVQDNEKPVNIMWKLQKKAIFNWYSNGQVNIVLVKNGHIGLGLRKVLKKVLKKALKKILLTQKSKCTFLSTQKSTQKFNFSECWVQKFTQKRSPKEILLKKVIYCPKLY